VAWQYDVTDMGDPPFPRPAPICALHLTSAGEAVESSPIELYVTDTYTHYLKAAPSPQGVVLAWPEIGNDLSAVTRVARYTGTTPLDPSTVLTAGGNLGDIAPLANGEVDIYWWSTDFATATIRYERLTPSLESQGDLFTTQPFPVSNQSVELAATVAGALPVVLHTQVEDSAKVTGISRLYVRQAEGMRRRAVR
jgi:hypothetical protein